MTIHIGYGSLVRTSGQKTCGGDFPASTHRRISVSPASPENRSAVQAALEAKGFHILPEPHRVNGAPMAGLTIFNPPDLKRLPKIIHT